MPALVPVFEVAGGKIREHQMYQIDLAHAQAVEPGRFFTDAKAAADKLAADAAADDAPAGGEGVTELPGLPRKPGRPRKDDGAG